MEQIPIGLDYLWFACDAVGHVARFTNGGFGPIPFAALADRELSDRAEILAEALPFLGGHEVRAKYPDPQDFADIARRGFFAYDWEDTHRTKDFSRRYEIATRPTRPLRIDELPPELRKLAQAVRFASLRFDDCESIPVSELVPCAT